MRYEYRQEPEQEKPFLDWGPQRCPGDKVILDTVTGKRYVIEEGTHEQLRKKVTDPHAAIGNALAAILNDLTAERK